MADLCPLCTQYRDINLANHYVAIKMANLGPADPRQPETAYWQAKMTKWGVPEGEARSRLCMNCEHYIATSEMLACVKSGPGARLKASDVVSTWADIPGLPAAVCNRYNITCNSIRTCDDWEAGGPITDSSQSMDPEG